MEPDYYIPQYWEAEKIIGLITDAQLSGVDATKIIGNITSSQIASLAAAKIAGQLTDAQIADLAAAKILGQLGTSQIAAGAITAGKIAVANLAAIAVDAGTITAGIFRGTTFETSAANPKVKLDGTGLKALNAAGTQIIGLTPTGGLSLTGGIGGVPTDDQKIIFELPDGRGVIYAYEVAGEIFLDVQAEGDFTDLTRLTLKATSASGAKLQIDDDNIPTDRNIKAIVGAFERTLLDGNGSSGFLQLASLANRKVAFGTATAPTNGATSANVVINHGLGATPLYAVATAVVPAIAQIPICTVGTFTATQLTVSAHNRTAGANFTANTTVYWLAIV